MAAVTGVDRAAVLQATAIAACVALVTGLVGVGVKEIEALLAERREKRKEQGK